MNKLNEFWKSRNSKQKTWISIASVLVVIGILGNIGGVGGANDSGSLEPNDSGTQSPLPTEENSEAADFAIQTVKERYEVDCFAGLGDETVYRYEDNPGGTMREGFVYASVGGKILQFSVGLNESTGSFITLPTDDLTIELLESVGC